MTRHIVTTNNVHIFDSYQVRGRDFQDELDAIKREYPSCNVWNRCAFSLRKEWATHNALYALGFKRERTKDADLNYPKKWWVTACYCVAGCIVWPFIR